MPQALVDELRQSDPAALAAKNDASQQHKPTNLRADKGDLAGPRAEATDQPPQPLSRFDETAKRLRHLLDHGAPPGTTYKDEMRRVLRGYRVGGTPDASSRPEPLAQGEQERGERTDIEVSPAASPQAMSPEPETHTSTSARKKPWPRPKPYAAAPTLNPSPHANLRSQTTSGFPPERRDQSLDFDVAASQPVVIDLDDTPSREELRTDPRDVPSSGTHVNIGDSSSPRRVTSASPPLKPTRNPHQSRSPRSPVHNVPAPVAAQHPYLPRLPDVGEQRVTDPPHDIGSSPQHPSPPRAVSHNASAHTASRSPSQPPPAQPPPLSPLPPPAPSPPRVDEQPERTSPSLTDPGAQHKSPQPSQFSLSPFSRVTTRRGTSLLLPQSQHLTSPSESPLHCAQRARSQPLPTLEGIDEGDGASAALLWDVSAPGAKRRKRAQGDVSSNASASLSPDIGAPAIDVPLHSDFDDTSMPFTGSVRQEPRTNVVEEDNHVDALPARPEAPALHRAKGERQRAAPARPHEDKPILSVHSLRESERREADAAAEHFDDSRATQDKEQRLCGPRWESRRGALGQPDAGDLLPHPTSIDNPILFVNPVRESKEVEVDAGAYDNAFPSHDRERILHQGKRKRGRAAQVQLHSDESLRDPLTINKPRAPVSPPHELAGADTDVAADYDDSFPFRDREQDLRRGKQKRQGEAQARPDPDMLLGDPNTDNEPFPVVNLLRESEGSGAGTEAQHYDDALSGSHRKGKPLPGKAEMQRTTSARPDPDDLRSNAASGDESVVLAIPCQKSPKNESTAALGNDNTFPAHHTKRGHSPAKGARKRARRVRADLEKLPHRLTSGDELASAASPSRISLGGKEAAAAADYEGAFAASYREVGHRRGRRKRHPPASMRSESADLQGDPMPQVNPARKLGCEEPVLASGHRDTQQHCTKDQALSLDNGKQRGAAPVRPDPEKLPRDFARKVEPQQPNNSKRESRQKKGSKKTGAARPYADVKAYRARDYSKKYNYPPAVTPRVLFELPGPSLYELPAPGPSSDDNPVPPINSSRKLVGDEAAATSAALDNAGSTRLSVQALRSVDAKGQPVAASQPNSNKLSRSPVIDGEPLSVGNPPSIRSRERAVGIEEALDARPEGLGLCPEEGEGGQEVSTHPDPFKLLEAEKGKGQGAAPARPTSDDLPLGFVNNGEPAPPIHPLGEPRREETPAEPLDGKVALHVSYEGQVPRPVKDGSQQSAQAQPGPNEMPRTLAMSFELKPSANRPRKTRQKQAAAPSPAQLAAEPVEAGAAPAPAAVRPGAGAKTRAVRSRSKKYNYPAAVTPRVLFEIPRPDFHKMPPPEPSIDDYPKPRSTSPRKPAEEEVAASPADLGKAGPARLSSQALRPPVKANGQRAAPAGADPDKLPRGSTMSDGPMLPANAFGKPRREEAADSSAAPPSSAERQALCSVNGEGQGLASARPDPGEPAPDSFAGDWRVGTASPLCKLGRRKTPPAPADSGGAMRARPKAQSLRRVKGVAPRATSVRPDMGEVPREGSKGHKPAHPLNPPRKARRGQAEAPRAAAGGGGLAGALVAAAIEENAQTSPKVAPARRRRRSYRQALRGKKLRDRHQNEPQYAAGLKRDQLHPVVKHFEAKRHFKPQPRTSVARRAMGRRGIAPIMSTKLFADYAVEIQRRRVFADRDLKLEGVPVDPNTEWSPAALHILQSKFENHMLFCLRDAAVAMKHAKRVTVYPEDLHLANKLRGLEGRHLTSNVLGP